MTDSASHITTRLHRVDHRGRETTQEWVHEPGELPFGGRASLLDRFLDWQRVRKGLLVAATSFSSIEVLNVVLDRGLPFVIELRPSSELNTGDQPQRRRVAEICSERHLELEHAVVAAPDSHVSDFSVAVAEVEGTCRWDGEPVRVAVIAPGGITDKTQLRYFAIPTAQVDLKNVLVGGAWHRWIRAEDRRSVRNGASSAPSAVLAARSYQIVQAFRPNITQARRQDAQMVAKFQQTELLVRPNHQVRADRTIKVAELFAGAGLLGLGFLTSDKLSRAFRLTFSGEINPIYAKTLELNHRFVAENIRMDPGVVPPSVEPVDLSSRATRDRLTDLDVDVVIGGPPCQGFSNANRNSWAADNPNNRLVEVFLSHVRNLNPRLVLMENVQGILWTPGSSARGGSAGELLVRRLQRLGYLVFGRLLDAVWYGVPQHRTRFFVVAIHRDLGWSESDFDSWGPFPKPTHGEGTGHKYVTVADAIGDLPPVGNGAENISGYVEPSATALQTNPFLATMRRFSVPGALTDHITSRNADYVVERYRRIAPGENWKAVADMMTNYARLDRTHSNIYRRLRWTEPAITIGHYRKSMIIHPEQDRGLSLREASRLQSIPDWFRFAGTTAGVDGGLMHKQQQLANAVAPLLAAALAETFLQLL